jgi:hypothetical protein
VCVRARVPRMHVSQHLRPSTPAHPLHPLRASQHRREDMCYVFYGVVTNAECAGYAFAAAFNRIVIMTANYCGEGTDEDRFGPARGYTDRRFGGGFWRGRGGGPAETSNMRANYRDGLVEGLRKAVEDEKLERKRLALERMERRKVAQEAKLEAKLAKVCPGGGRGGRVESGVGGGGWVGAGRCPDSIFAGLLRFEDHTRLPCGSLRLVLEYRCPTPHACLNTRRNSTYWLQQRADPTVRARLSSTNQT